MMSLRAIGPGVSVVHQSSDDRHWPQPQHTNLETDTTATTIRKATTTLSNFSITDIPPDHIDQSRR